METTERNGRTPAAYKKLNFGNKRSLAKSLKNRRLKSADVVTLLEAARRESPAKAEQLAAGIVAKRKRRGEERDSVRGMVRWTRNGGAQAEERRRTVVKAFRNRRGILLVHGISELPAAEGAAFMKTYFANGGDLGTVAQWLSAAGSVMGRHQPTPVNDVSGGLPVPIVAPARAVNGRSAKGLFDWADDAWDTVTDWIEDAADTAQDAVDSIVAAIEWLGMSVAAVVGTVASWTVAQITDVVRALIAAGRSVASILAEALNRSVLRKFAEALIRAGRSIGSILAWATQKAAAIIKDAVAGILAAGRSIFQVLSWAASATVALAQKTIRALIDIGKTVAQIMADIVRFSATLVYKLVAALYAVVQAIGSILAAVAQTAAGIIRTVIQGLFMAGVTLVKMVAAICVDVAEAFRKGFIQGLIALAKTPLEILVAAAATSAGILALAFAALLEALGGHRPLTAAEKTEARKVFGWSIDLDRVRIAVASLPSDVINYLNGQRPFTTMYVINFASSAHIDMPTLIHELTHVWQGVVAGPIYMVEALHSQFFGRGYDVTDAEITAANGDLSKLQREQQAVVVERYYRGKFGGEGSTHDYRKYEPLANDVYRARPAILPPVRSFLPRMLPLTRRVARVPRVTLGYTG